MAMERSLLEDISSKLEVLNVTLKQLLDVTLNGKSEVIGTLLNIEAHLNTDLDSVSDHLTAENDRPTDNFIPDSSFVQRQTSKVKKSISGVWKKSLNERKQAYWNSLKLKNIAQTYELWLENENPVMMRKFRPKHIAGEHEEDIEIRKQNALRNVASEIQIMKNKSRRYESKFKQIDDEMHSIFRRRAQSDVLERLNEIWNRDCDREEKKSCEIWENKKKWYDEYETNFGSDIFVSEEDTTLHHTRNKSQQSKRTNTGRQRTERQFVELNTGSNASTQNSRRRVQSYNEVEQNYPDNSIRRGTTYSDAVQTPPDNRHNRNKQTIRNNGRRLDAIQSERQGTKKQNNQHQNGHRFQKNWGNKTTYIGSNVRSPFLGLSRYDRDRGRFIDREQREERRPDPIDIEIEINPIQQQEDLIILEEETNLKEIV